MLGAFVHGLLLALALILPLGPQNTFVLTQGATAARFRSVLPVIITAALSDTLLIVLAVAGVSLVLLALPALRLLLSVAGVLFLFHMGYRAWTARPDESAGGEAAEERLGRKVRHSLSVSLLNPHAISDTVIVIGGGAALYTNAADKWAYAVAAALVSWVWFTALALAGRLVSGFARRPGARRALQRLSALVMWAVGVRYAVAVTKSMVTPAS